MGPIKARLETREGKAHGISMETPRENDTHPGATSPRNRRKNDDERVLSAKGEGSELGKERETRFSLTSSLTIRQRPPDPTATENSTSSPHSQRTVNTLTSDEHEIPPENPATE